MSDYPTEAELDELRTFDTLARGVKPLTERVRELWHNPDWGYRIYRTKDPLFGACVGLELHTGGWSGNESIISALERNYLFWSLSWNMSKAGGHYWFRIHRDRWRGYGPPPYRKQEMAEVSTMTTPVVPVVRNIADLRRLFKRQMAAHKRQVAKARQMTPPRYDEVYFRALEIMEGADRASTGRAAGSGRV